jgi:hypothetical protein
VFTQVQCDPARTLRDTHQLACPERWGLLSTCWPDHVSTLHVIIGGSYYVIGGTYHLGEDETETFTRFSSQHSYPLPDKIFNRVLVPIIISSPSHRGIDLAYIWILHIPSFLTDYYEPWRTIHAKYPLFEGWDPRWQTNTRTQYPVHNLSTTHVAFHFCNISQSQREPSTIASRVP